MKHRTLLVNVPDNYIRSCFDNFETIEKQIHIRMRYILYIYLQRLHPIRSLLRQMLVGNLEQQTNNFTGTGQN